MFDHYINFPLTLNVPVQIGDEIKVEIFDTEVTGEIVQVRRSNLSGWEFEVSAEVKYEATVLSVAGKPVS
jgi:hypothetical protein